MLALALFGCEAESPARPEPGTVLFGSDLNSVVLELTDPVRRATVGVDLAYLAGLRDGTGDVVSVQVRLDEEVILETTEAPPAEGLRLIGGAIPGERISRPGRLTLSVGSDGDVLAEGSIDVRESPVSTATLASP